MKKKNVAQVSGQTADRLHDGKGSCSGGTLFTRDELGGGSWRFIDYWRIPPGTTVGAHRHAEGRELYFIISGEGELTTNGVAEKVAAGDMILNEPGDCHAFANMGDETVVVMVTNVQEGDSDAYFENVPDDA